MSVGTMTQCKLIRVSWIDKIKRNWEVQTTWILTKYATYRHRVGLREKTPQGGAYWDEGWVVDEIYNTLPSEYVLERSQDYKKTREASDV